MNNTSLNPIIRFRYNRSIIFANLFLALPNVIFVFGLSVYGLARQFPPRIGGDPYGWWFAVLVLICMMAFLLFGIYETLKELSSTRISEEGTTKYILKWRQHCIDWNDCTVYIGPTSTPLNRKRSMAILIKPLNIPNKNIHFISSKDISFYTINISENELPEIIETLNYYILKYCITVHYREDPEITGFKEIGRIPLPPYSWEGKPSKKKDRMDIDW